MRSTPTSIGSSSSLLDSTSAESPSPMSDQLSTSTSESSCALLGDEANNDDGSLMRWRRALSGEEGGNDASASDSKSRSETKSESMLEEESSALDV